MSIPSKAAVVSCPECGRPTETVTEENYFFRLSCFQDQLLELYEKQARAGLIQAPRQ